MTGNPLEGIHNLKIEDARIEDDGDYQCQIGPGVHSKPIRADSKVTVLSKYPSSHSLVPFCVLHVELLIMETAGY